MQMFTAADKDRKRDGDQPEGIYDKLRPLLPEADPEQALCAVPFNLDATDPTERHDGIFYADQQNLTLVTDGQITFRMPLSEIGEMKTNTGVGCIFVSYTLRSDGSVHLLCRSDMNGSERIIRSLKRLNYFLEDGKVLRSQSPDEAGNRCPKCGRPYRPGSTICVHSARSGSGAFMPSSRQTTDEKSDFSSIKGAS